MDEIALRVKKCAPDTPVLQRIIQVLTRVVANRCGATVAFSGNEGYLVELAIDAGIGQEGYCIEDIDDGGVRITGNEEAGLLFGVGKYLHTAHYGEGAFTPGSWRGTSVPQRPFRAIYFATHFHNFYHDAPIEKVQEYIEDLALWGYNGLAVWFDMHHYTGFDDPDAVQFLTRLKVFLGTAKSLGLQAGILVLANEAFHTSPEELRADWHADDNGYTVPLSHYHVEVCPSKPAGRAYILRNLEEEFQQFADIGLDFLTIWPYDQGGCTCAQCKPWGGNGYVSIAKEIAGLFRRYFPGAKLILSAWLFERYIQGEFAALDAALGRHCTWADYLMVQLMYVEPFPAYPLRHGVPGGLPLLDFPEISMCGHGPWGAFGCNPFASKLRPLWDEGKHLLAGGFPYSEGIYEDINKIVYSQFYWGDTAVEEAIHQYASFYFGDNVADDLTRIIAIMEATHVHEVEEETDTVNMPEMAGAEQEWPIVQAVAARMTSYAQRDWRWRLIYLRALLDAELTANDRRLTDRCYHAFQELTEIYHAQYAVPGLKPPARTHNQNWQALWEESKA